MKYMTISNEHVLSALSQYLNSLSMINDDEVIVDIAWLEGRQGYPGQYSLTVEKKIDRREDG